MPYPKLHILRIRAWSFKEDYRVRSEYVLTINCSGCLAPRGEPCWNISFKKISSSFCQERNYIWLNSKVRQDEREWRTKINNPNKNSRYLY